MKRSFALVFIGLFGVTIILVMGCSPNEREEAEVESTESDNVFVAPVRNEKDALAIAMMEVERRGWDAATNERVSFQDGVWTVRLVRVPEVPGGHAVIKIADDGKVISYQGGR